MNGWVGVFITVVPFTKLFVGAILVGSHCAKFFAVADGDRGTNEDFLALGRPAQSLLFMLDDAAHRPRESVM
jgi:hypothetical protein